jgi:hypothetical protein
VQRARVPCRLVCDLLIFWLYDGFFSHTHTHTLGTCANHTLVQVMVIGYNSAGAYAKDTSDSTFTLQQLPSTVSVIAPNGGEIFGGGSVVHISWVATRAVSYSVEYSLCGGCSYVPISNCLNLPSTVTSCSWSTGTSITDLARVRVNAVHLAGGSCSSSDASDANFAIGEVFKKVLFLFLFY